MFGFAVPRTGFPFVGQRITGAIGRISSLMIEAVAVPSSITTEGWDGTERVICIVSELSTIPSSSTGITSAQVLVPWGIEITPTQAVFV